MTESSQKVPRMFSVRIYTDL